MLRKILIYGVIGGLIVGIPLSIMTTVKGCDPGPYGMAIGYTMMLIALSTVFIAVKKHRDDDLGGVIRFWPAFGLGLGISVVASIIYVVSWETAVAISHMDFATIYTQALIEKQKAAGVHGEELKKLVDSMEEFKRNYANPLYRWPMTFVEIFPVGVLVSLISAALLRSSRFLPARRA